MVLQNPIRKVVSMLQAMQKKVTEEGAKEKALYEKFMCYCQTSGGKLRESVAAAQGKMPALSASIKAATEEQVQLEAELKIHQTDRAAAKTSIAEATALREKEAAAFQAEKQVTTADIKQVDAAVFAISRGMAGGFLQTKGAQILRKLASTLDMVDGDRQTLMAFLSGTQVSDYAPNSGEIVGILKEMSDTMKKNLADATAEENEAIANYEALKAAKEKEVLALNKAIEAKMARKGDLAVSIVQMKNDLTDSEESLLEDQKFLADLEAGCGSKTQEWEARSQTRAEELVALADTIKLLNEDESLDLFKKTLQSPSFVQIKGVSKNQALSLIRTAREAWPRSSIDLDFIALALQGKKISLDKVMKMIDEMVATLEQEQKDDDTKKEYCAQQLDTSDDSKKELEAKIEGLETAIAAAEDGIAKLKEEVTVLQKDISALDKSVAEATRQRKAEHEEFTESIAANSAAMDLLHLAVNRLNQFYNPKLAKPISKPAETETLAQIALHIGHKEAPPPPPETFGAYTKSEQSSGVIALLNRLLSELEKDNTVAETEEEDAQKDYEGMMKDAAEKRATDLKSIGQKMSAKAAMESELQANKESKASSTKELSATLEYIASLHSECDWLMKYHSVREEARAGEIDSLKKAKAILSGADLSLVQSHKAGGLRR